MTTAPGGSVQPVKLQPVKGPTLCQSDAKPWLPEFTARQFQIIDLVTQGMKNRDIGERVGTTEQVVKNYLRAIYDKTGMDSRVQLALWWMTKKPAYVAAGIIAE